MGATGNFDKLEDVVSDINRIRNANRAEEVTKQIVESSIGGK